jgi:3D (Asp-Asp-Asp) domain-containing protein
MKTQNVRPLINSVTNSVGRKSELIVVVPDPHKGQASAKAWNNPVTRSRMDHMDKKWLGKRIGIVCFSTLLLASVLETAADAHALPQTRTSSAYASSVTNRAAGAYLTDKTKGEPKAEAPRESAIAAPKIGPKNPALELKIKPRESKLNAAGFEAPASLGESINFRATAYALPGRTRMGTMVRRGVIAADPRVLPLGSVVEVRAGNWSGTYTVTDTGGKIKGKIIDVWVPTRKEARQFGRRSVKLHVLRFGPKK